MAIVLRNRQGESATTKALPDSGAEASIMPARLARLLYANRRFHPATESLVAVNGARLRCYGCVYAQVTFQGNTTPRTLRFLVTPDVSETLVGWRHLIEIGVLPKDFPCLLQPSRQSTTAPGSSSSTTKVRSVTAPDDALEAVKTRLLHEFSDVLSNSLSDKVIKGPPVKIHLEEGVDIKPLKVFTARQVPLHWQEEADRVVQEHLDAGIIERVTWPTDWISQGGFAPKEGGKAGLRLFADFQRLNTYVKRPVHPFPSSIEVLRKISPDAKFFCKLDCVKGYYQIELDPSSADRTTFLLPSGRYRFKRCPMGLSSSGDEFVCRTDLAFQGLTGICKLVDDVLVFAADIATLEARVRSVLERCQEHSITMSERKFSFGTTAKFAGHIVSGDGVFPDPDTVAAIKKFKSPTDTTSLKSFLGLAVQLGHYVPDLAHMTRKMRMLLKKGVAWQWLDDHEEELRRAKEILTSPLVVKPFDPGLQTSLLTDASRLHGLGFLLLQTNADGSHRLVTCGSRSLTPAEGRYATIELELLAITYAMEKCNFFLLGLKSFKVVTDHRPLIGIFHKSLCDIRNVRLQRLREKVVCYNFRLEWCPGKQHAMADALSRCPVFEPPAPDNDDDADVSAAALDVRLRLVSAGASLSRSDQLRLRDFLIAAKADDAYNSVVDAVRRDANPSNLPHNHAGRAYAGVWDNLSLVGADDGALLLYDGHRIVVPLGARRQLLARLHTAHQGRNKTLKLAKDLYYWPGMVNAICQTIDACSVCQSRRPSLPAEPLIQTTAVAPMEVFCVDLFEEAKKQFLVGVDAYSGFPFVHELRSTTSAAVISTLKSWFNEWGRPTAIRSDGGPQFRGEFKTFCEEWGIVHDDSSSYFAQSNGQAEAAVKNMKALVSKCRETKADFRVSLAEWRNVPRAEGFSPAQLFLGRRQRGVLPCLLPASPCSPDTRREAEQLRAKVRANAKTLHDAHARSHASLSLGTAVYIQDPSTKRWSGTGTITEARDRGRSYYVRTPSGRVTLRNRRQLRPRPAASLSPAASSSASPPAVTRPPAALPSPALRRSSRLARKPAKRVTFAPGS